MRCSLNIMQVAQPMQPIRALNCPVHTKNPGRKNCPGTGRRRSLECNENATFGLCAFFLYLTALGSGIDYNKSPFSFPPYSMSHVFVSRASLQILMS